MAELDLLLDSLIEQQNAPEVSYIDDKNATALEVKQLPSKGHALFAKRSLAVQSPICSLDYPTMMAIEADFIRTTCYHCLVITATQLPLPSYGHTPIALSICNGCRTAHFCNRECQVKAWHAYHKYECKILKKLQSNIPSAILRAVMRVVLLKDRNILASQEWDRITRLTSHEHLIAARGQKEVMQMAETIKFLTQSSMGTEMIQRLVSIMNFNAIELPTPIHGGIGVMLDPLVAKINNSCEPNVSIHRPQHTMASGWMHSTQLSEDEKRTFAHIIPLREIQEGEELLISYVAATVSVNVRKKKFKEDYFFDCNCPRCVSDLTATADLAKEQPDLSARYEQWTSNVLRHLSRMNHDSSALQKGAAAMYKSEPFLEYPVLYKTGDFPLMAMGIIKEALKGQVFEEALVNVLRLHFLVNPECFVGRHNPTHIYTIFLLLDIVDAILGVSTPSEVSESKREEWLRNLAVRGMSKNVLIYWRYRICADLRKRVEEGTQKDLLVLVEKNEQRMQHLSPEDQGTNEELKTNAEREMRSILGVKEPRWDTILQHSGC